MNRYKGILFKQSICVFMLLGLVLTSFVLAVEKKEQAHEVKAQDGEVEKNDQIDHENTEEETSADEVKTIDRMFREDRIKIISKTFDPPANMKFEPFNGLKTHVDIRKEPGALNPKAKIDKDDEIKVEATFLESDAANWPLRAEGNISQPVGTGGGVAKKLYWAAKVATASIEVKFQGDIESDLELGIFYEGETLGLRATYAGWFWPVEVKATLPPSENASQWEAKQSIEGRSKGRGKTSQNEWKSFDFFVQKPDDDPLDENVQKEDNLIYWIDGPGPLWLREVDGERIETDSVTWVCNFISWVEKDDEKYEVKWYVKIIVEPGGKLNRNDSEAGYGHLSLEF